jgi:hypothetical protein
LLHFFHDIDGNAYDEYAVVTLLGLEFLKERYFAAARRAPGSPEVEQTVTAVEFVEVVHVAVESQQFEGRMTVGPGFRRGRHGIFTDGGRHPGDHEQGACHQAKECNTKYQKNSRHNQLPFILLKRISHRDRVEPSSCAEARSCINVNDPCWR